MLISVRLQIMTGLIDDDTARSLLSQQIIVVESRIESLVRREEKVLWVGEGKRSLNLEGSDEES